MQPDPRHEHRTAPEPEPVRPGRYKLHPFGVVVECLGEGEYTDRSEVVVVYRPAGSRWLYADSRESFARRFTRLPDAPPISPALRDHDLTEEEAAELQRRIDHRGSGPRVVVRRARDRPDAPAAQEPSS